HSKIAGISSTSDGGQLKIVLTATDMYLSGPATFQGKTLRARLTKLHDNTPDDLFADILVPLHILGSATNVQATAPTTFAGKLDLTKISTTAIGTRKFLDYVIRAGGDKVKSLDFNATVDGSGYLAQFQATLPAIDNGKDADYRVDFSDFGKPVTVKTPTANVVEAPASFYTAT
ncbi:MAG: hypothetical protein J2P15_23015, partial [Micromonosporaceae bacterium]|nr:hypothetical protein [Micromonosporaceae bacterium]